MKLTVLFQTDSSLVKTGFGRNSKALIKYLYNTGKYNIIQYCGGVQYSHPELKRTPWLSIGCLPDNPQEIEYLNRDPNLVRLASYGAHYLDKVITEQKPDVYIAVQDFWGVDFAIDKPWFNKISSVIWTTLDSLPILPQAIDKAKSIKNYWIWSDFATKELHRLGHKHVKTVHGALEDADFYRLSDKQKLQLRQSNNLPENSFIIGFVFRNQLRKSVPNLLEGYSIWKNQNPEIKNTFLLLHTSFAEGWDIQKFANEYKVPMSEILTTYICKSCKNYEVKPFIGHEANCKFCRKEKSQNTTNIAFGVSESQLNEIYNLMDVYCHPFTSGGQEIPVQEAKLAELITLVTNYSCGEELCEEGSASIPLEWSEYREFGTQFRKASTFPSSIAKQINKVYQMDKNKRNELGKQARNWTLENFSVKKIGKLFEDFLDLCPKVFDANAFRLSVEEKNPHAIIPPIEEENKWIISLYKEILKMDVDENDDGFKNWKTQLKNNMPRKDIETYFRQVAEQENQKNSKVTLEDLLDKNDVGKRILYVIPESIGDVFLSTSLFNSIKKTYPDYNLYVATKPENFQVLEGNQTIHRIIPYNPQLDNLLWLEGQGGHKGYFEIAFLPFIGTQKILNYVHNGKDIIQLDLN